MYLSSHVRLGSAVSRYELPALKVAHFAPVGTHTVDDIIGGAGEGAEPAFALADRAFRLTAERRHADLRIDARQQLPRAEGLGDVVVRASRDAFDAGFLPGPRGQKDDGDRTKSWIGAQFAKQAEAIEPWHHDVAQHEVRRVSFFLH